MTVEQDHLLMGKLAMGDRSALAPLFERYKDPLVRLFYQLTGRVEDAEELTQETFMRLLEMAPRYQVVWSFRAYLFKMALNLGRTHLRRKARQEKRNSRAFNAPSNPPTPDQEVSRRETQELVSSALRSLSEEERLVVAMKEFEGMKFREIAWALEIPLGTAKSRLRYALKKLALKLAKLQEP